MCGIAGFLDFDGKTNTEEGSTIAARMADRLSHRGPDDSGTWADPAHGVFLAHRRLSIIDLSPGGHQPMASANGRYVIVFNGEIYNHDAIRRRLEAEGLSPGWRGHSDTEVLLAGIAAWGIRKALQSSVGMFALALWDRSERQLWLARDRLGEKPVYWGYCGRALLFASELKSFTACPELFRAEINRHGLALMLRFGYVPAPFSIYNGVRKLAPGTMLRFDAGSPDPVEDSFWSCTAGLAATQRGPDPISDESAIGELEKLLHQSVAGQIVADVPVGCFLSGGIDSSVVTAIAQSISNRPVKTFSIGFHEQQYNEAHHAKEIAAHLGTDHTELYVTSRDALDVIPLLPSIYDEPFADPSQIPTYLVSKLARTAVTVSLSGDGGDELFAGYRRYSAGKRLWECLSPFPLKFRQTIKTLLSGISQENIDRVLNPIHSVLPQRHRLRNPGDKIRKAMGLIDSHDIDDLHLRLMSQWQDPFSVVLESDGQLPHLPPSLKFSDPIAKMSWRDTLTYLPDDILVKLDRASMANSLESRVPLLDHRIVEFAMGLPTNLKIREGIPKWILRQILYKHVPKSMVDRPKMGFGVPIETWLRGPLRDWAENLLAEPRLRQEGFFAAAPIRLKWAEHLSGKRNWHNELWSVLMFQAWLEEIS